MKRRKSMLKGLRPPSRGPTDRSSADKVHGRTCALCLKSTTLCHSHILPEFLFSETYDDEHHKAAFAFNLNPNRTTMKLQKGPREYLLCATCEAQFSGYELYASRFVKDILESNSSGFERAIEIDYEYSRLKLFGLSVLWRCHATTMHAFRNVDLGPLAEVARKRLVANDPGKRTSFPFLITRFVDPQTVQKSSRSMRREGETTELQTIVTLPVRRRSHGRTLYRFLAHGLGWTFLASNRVPGGLLRPQTVGHGSRLVIPIRRLTRDEFLRAFAPLLPDDI